ncbi:50S ribosomal protein L36 [Candidatus Neomarinimicrobiota bacterium]
MKVRPSVKKICEKYNHRSKH